MTPQERKERLAAILAAAKSWHEEGATPFEIVQRLSGEVDQLLVGVFSEVLAGQLEDVTLVAVGGYGRRELCPRSDVDVLILRRRDQAAQELERLIQILWDSGFDLGSAVRTIKECSHYMSDHSTATSMLESRFLAGSQTLFEEYQTRCVQRFRRRHADGFARAKMDRLRQSIEDSRRPIYVIEPNLKDGPCGLRDVQRILWIQNIRHQGGTLDALLRQRRFSPEEVRGVQEAYEFYLGARCQLHFVNGLRVDVLERDSQTRVARNLGYGADADDRAAVEEFMGDYYRHARLVYRFARFFLESGAHRSFWSCCFPRRLLDTKLGEFLVARKGRLFLSQEPPSEKVLEEILRVFELAQKKDLRLSEALCQWIRRKLPTLSEDLSHSRPVQVSFVSILRDGRSVGRLLKTLHGTGVLCRILPEFTGLDCLVSFDGHHQFTVDEHTLKTLEELGRIETEEDYPEAVFRTVALETKDRFPLRLALLLHDIGKAIPGSHSVSGKETAGVICERLGLTSGEKRTVEFLVYCHLELYRISERRDFNEDGVVEGLARLVGTEDRLHMLYLLTYLDIVSVGPGTWTRWKGSQLTDLYRRTLGRLRTGTVPDDNLDVILEASGLDAADREAVVEHCGKVQSPGYVRDMVPERMLGHRRMIDRHQADGRSQVTLEDALGSQEVTFLAPDRACLFADFTGLLLSEGLNVLNARAYEYSDRLVLDVFHVEVADGVRLDHETRLKRIRRRLKALEGEDRTVEDFIQERVRFYKFGRWTRPLFGPAVSIDNQSSPFYSLIEVSAGDKPGLLHDLAVALDELRLDVRMAKVSTLAERAHDVFYVTQSAGGKVQGAATQRAIRRALIESARRPPRTP